MPVHSEMEIRRFDPLGAEVWSGVWHDPSADHHAHAGLQLLLTTSGRARLAVGAGYVPLRVGTLLAIPAGTVHAIRPVRGQPWGFETTYVSTPTVADLLDRSADLIAGGAVWNTSEPGVLAVWERWHRLATTTGSSADRRDALRSALRPIASKIGDDGHRGTDTRLRIAREWLDRYFTENRPLAEVADLIDLSPEHFSRLFTRRVGLSPHAYRVQRRVQKAVRLLGRGQPLAHVAVACGFADQPHLNRHFRRVVGLTPGRYAAAVKNVQDPPTGEA